MKRIILLATLALFTTATITAQRAPRDHQPDSRPDSVQADKKRPDGKARLLQQTKHYVELFALDEKQAAEFTEIFHAYNKKLHAIRQQYRPERPQEGEELTDEQIEQRMINHFAQSRAILDVREEYYKEFRKVLTPKQVQVIYKEEKDRRDRMQGPRPDRRPEGGRPDSNPQPRPDRPQLAR